MHDEPGSTSNDEEDNNAGSDGGSTSTSSDQANSPLRFDESNDQGSERLRVPLDLWELQLRRARSLVTTKFLNKLVMSYLIVEGDQLAARTFAEESGTTPDIDLSTIEQRQNIRQNILKGDMDGAIESINVLNKDILHSSEDGLSLLFSLKKQTAIEIIRSGDVAKALKYVQDEVGPIVKLKPDLMGKMEEVMLLLVFSDINVAPTSCRQLMALECRTRLAVEVNAYLLRSLSQSTTDKISMLIKENQWMQKKLHDMAVIGVPAMKLNSKKQATSGFKDDNHIDSDASRDGVLESKE
eukprot:g8612.t1